MFKAQLVAMMAFLVLFSSVAFATAKDDWFSSHPQFHQPHGSFLDKLRHQHKGQFAQVTDFIDALQNDPTHSKKDGAHDQVEEYNEEISEKTELYDDAVHEYQTTIEELKSEFAEDLKEAKDDFQDDLNNLNYVTRTWLDKKQQVQLSKFPDTMTTQQKLAVEKKLEQKYQHFAVGRGSYGAPKTKRDARKKRSIMNKEAAKGMLRPRRHFGN